MFAFYYILCYDNKVKIRIAIKNYFIIGDFAKLRDININALRYSEKIVLLKPAYIDFHSRYRYYSFEQLAVLDTILSCINLEILLKNLTDYVEKDKVINDHKHLEQGRRIAEKKRGSLKSPCKKLNMSYIARIKTGNMNTRPDSTNTNTTLKNVILLSKDAQQLPLNTLRTKKRGRSLFLCETQKHDSRITSKITHTI